MMATYEIYEWIEDGHCDYTLVGTPDGRHPTVVLTEAEVAAYEAARLAWDRWQRRLEDAFYAAAAERE